MPGAKSDEYWARFAYGYCQVAKVSLYPARDYAPMVDMGSKTISTAVHRLRARGIMVPQEQGNFLTDKALEILGKERWEVEGYIALDLRVRAGTKAEALAEVWDVISQLEHWDPRSGEPFRLKPSRIKRLGLPEDD